MLNQVMSELEKIVINVPTDNIPMLIGELERLKAMVWARMMLSQNRDGQASPSSGHQGRWLTPAQAAKIFAVSERWFYRHKKRLPHSQPSRKVLLFPEESLRRWFEKRA